MSASVAAFSRSARCSSAISVRAARPYTCTPGTSSAPDSTSGGMARSRIDNGRSCRVAIAQRTCSTVMTGDCAAVQVTTASTVAMASGTSSMDIAVPFSSAAVSTALCGRREATRRSRAPDRLSARAASLPVSPAPTSRTLS